MLTRPKPVQLTKIHFFNNSNNNNNNYYNNNNNNCRQQQEISIIFRDNHENRFNNNTNHHFNQHHETIIKKNIFGHKWVLKINDNGPLKKNKRKCSFKLSLYAIVFICILIAVGSGIYFTLGQRLDRHEVKTEVILLTPGEHNSTPVATVTKLMNVTEVHDVKSKYCRNCLNDTICLKLTETERPQCYQPKDRKDPTGCGGHCSVNIQFCQLLDTKHRIFQCSNLTRNLKCPTQSFNCGNMCIKKEKRCDGIVNCSNGSDEIDCDCDLKTHFRCGKSNSCLPKIKKCNGIVDCWDKSDEMNCETNQSCQNGTVPCLNGACIPKEHFCDGLYHCKDRSDEPKGCQLST